MQTKITDYCPTIFFYLLLLLPFIAPFAVHKLLAKFYRFFFCTFLHHRNESRYQNRREDNNLFNRIHMAQRLLLVDRTHFDPSAKNDQKKRRYGQTKKKKLNEEATS